ncbi:hypothetical protein [Bacillus sp. WP8]|uniref:hypothetical protein n=1 Tax=Bacillus sp. WP8 TaxID=756828 RepID=UPI0011A8FA48|nr:hypothetical protein [Bacillus sp. WP8]
MEMVVVGHLKRMNEEGDKADKVRGVRVELIMVGVEVRELEEVIEKGDDGVSLILSESEECWGKVVMRNGRLREGVKVGWDGGEGCGEVMG